MTLLGHQIGGKLCKALGLPKNTIGFTLRCRAGELVSVECEYLPEGSFDSAFAQFELVRKVESAPPEQPRADFDTWYRERQERAHRRFMVRTSGLQPLERWVRP